MSAGVGLFDTAGEVLELPIEFGEYKLLEGAAGKGEVKEIILANTGTTALRNVSIYLDGLGADSVSMARKEGDGPGVWAAAGESIIITERALLPGDAIPFYARAIFDPDDVEGTFPFELKVRATSVGSG